MRASTWILLACALCAAQDWPRFRGSNGNGVSESAGLPLEFGPSKNLLWKARVPFARSSPAIAGDRIFLTAVEGEKLVTLCLDRGTGSVVWRKEILRPRATTLYKANDGGTPSPATDGKNVYVFFLDLGLVSYAPDGQERWRLPLGPFQTFYGLSASPIVTGNTVLMLCDTRTKGFLVAVDAATGGVRWRVERREIQWESYTTPLLYEDQVVVLGAHRLDAYLVATGERIWWMTGLAFFPVGSPVLANGMLIFSTWGADAPAGPTFDDLLKKLDKDSDGRISPQEAMADPDIGDQFGGLDTNGNGFLERAEWDALRNGAVGKYGLAAVRLGKHGDLTPAGFVWRETKTYPNLATPLVYKGVVYVVKAGGILGSLDLPTDKVLKVERAKEALEEHYSSPVAADGKVFFTNAAGKVIVLRAGAQWEVLAVNDLGEEAYATPAIAGSTIYIRTHDTVWAFQGR